VRIVAAALVLLAGCTFLRDPHAPRTVTASEAGGQFRVDHGERLRVLLPGEKDGGYEWRRIEPQIVAVVPEGPPQKDGWYFTPVRSGKETLRFESAERAVTYDITVR
jgi:hypothetical protein